MAFSFAFLVSLEHPLALSFHDHRRQLRSKSFVRSKEFLPNQVNHIRKLTHAEVREEGGLIQRSRLFAPG